MKGLKLVALMLAATAWLVGCSSGGGTTPPPGGTGRVAGNLGSDAGGGTVQLDGTDLRAAVNPDGSFALNGVPPGEYTLSVTGADGSGGAVLVRVEPDQTTTIGPLELGVAGQIAGLVTVAGQGRGIAGARVVARYVPLLWEYAGDAQPGVVDGVNSAGGAAARQFQPDDPANRPPPRVAVTDDDGSFRFTGVQPGPYTVEVSSDGFESSEVGTWVSEGLTAVADAQLVAIDPDNATLGGTVLGRDGSDTQRLAQVRVDLWPLFNDGTVPPLGANGGGGGMLPERPPIAEGDDPWYVPPYWYGNSTFTDEQGGFALRNLQPGSYSLTISRFGYESYSAEITLAARENRTVDVILDYILATVAGTVFEQRRDGSTAPLPGVWVNAYGSTIGPDDRPLAAEQMDPSTGGGGAGLSYPPPGVAQTDESGRYELEVQAGQVTVSAWQQGYEYAQREVTVSRPGATGIDLTLVPLADLTVTVDAPANVAGGADVPITLTIANNDTVSAQLWGPPYGDVAVYNANGEWVWSPFQVLALRRRQNDQPGIGGFPSEPRVLAPGESVSEDWVWPGTDWNGQTVADGWYFIVAYAHFENGEAPARAIAVGAAAGPAPSWPPQTWWYDAAGNAEAANGGG